MGSGAIGSLMLEQDYTRGRGVDSVGACFSMNWVYESRTKGAVLRKSSYSGVPCCIIGGMSAATAHIPEPLVERRLPPGPSGLRFYFSLLRIPKNWLRFLGRLAKNYGDISFFHLLNVPICFIN